jgi:hypothetical protein
VPEDQDQAGKIAPLGLNQAQIYLHGRLEAQRERTGKVRALVLKGGSRASRPISAAGITGEPRIARASGFSS